MKKNRSRKRKASYELIDTLWNVNIFNSMMMANVKIELIDTLWNVNMISVYQMGEVLGN